MYKDGGPDNQMALKGIHKDEMDSCSQQVSQYCWPDISPIDAQRATFIKNNSNKF